jgi:hypothetical protein
MSKKIVLQSSSASLELSDSAKLTGTKVKLGQGAGATGSQSSSTSDTQTLAVRFIDATGAALANATYQASFGDAMVQGTTDGSGGASITVPKDTQSVRVVVWPETFPEGPRVTYAVSVGSLDDASSVRGAQQRLRNLGYYRGPITGAMNRATLDALLVFQRHAQLDVTGELDAATVDKLRTAHD